MGSRSGRDGGPEAALGAVLLSILAAVSLAAALQMLVFRLFGLGAPLDLLWPLLLVLGLLHAAAALPSIWSGDSRSWRLAVLAGPCALAFLPLVDARLGLPGAGVLLLAFLAAVLLAPRVLPKGGDPVFAAGIGAAMAPLVLGLGTVLLWRTTMRGARAAALIVVFLAAAALVELIRPLRPRRTGSLALRIASLVALPVVVLATVSPPRRLSLRTSSPPLAAGASRPPAVLIVLDALRADRLKSYGCERDTMPNLERFAREGMVRVERSLASGSHSFQTHGSIFTGLQPYRHSPVAVPVDSARLGAVPTLAGLLHRAGYLTAGVSANSGPLAPALGLSRGFEHYVALPSAMNVAAKLNPYRAALHRRTALMTLDGFPPFSRAEFFTGGVPYRRAAEIVDEAIEVVSDAGARPFFLFLNVFDAHDPYRAPAWVPPFPDGRPPALERQGLPPLLCQTSPAARTRLLARYDTDLRGSSAE